MYKVDQYGFSVGTLPGVSLATIPNVRFHPYLPKPAHIALDVSGNSLVCMSACQRLVLSSFANTVVCNSSLSSFDFVP